MHEKLLLDAMHSFIQALKFVALQHALQLVLSSHSQVTQSPTVTTAYFPGAHQIRTRLQNIECSHTKVIMVEHCTQCHISLQWVNKTSTDESTRCENEVRYLRSTTNTDRHPLSFVSRLHLAPCTLCAFSRAPLAGQLHPSGAFELPGHYRFHEKALSPHFLSPKSSVRHEAHHNLHHPTLR